MSDLKSFVILQARVYEFLAQQDETTLQTIVSGSAQLAVLGDGHVQDAASVTPREGARIAAHPVSAGKTTVPSRDPAQVAQDLSRLTSEYERRTYLNAAKLQVKELQQVAKLLRLKKYSHLTRPKLVEFLADHGPVQAESVASEPNAQQQPPTYPVDHSPPATAQATDRDAQQPPAIAQPTADAAAIAAHLRETETEEEGAAYLQAQHLDRDSLLAVAAALQLTRVDRLSQKELKRRVLKQAIGARRKFAGLRNW